MKINLSKILYWYDMGAKLLMYWMKKRGYTTLVNDYSPAKIEYELDDIPASYNYWIKHFQNTIKSN
jgi:hypothetical protein